MYKVKDNAEAQLQFGISSVATTLVVKEGQGVKFPEVPFLVVLNKRNSDWEITKSEKVEVSAVNGDQFTISRGFEWTTPSDFSADDFVSLFVLAKHIEQLQDKVEKKAEQSEMDSVSQRTTSLEQKISRIEESWGNDHLEKKLMIGESMAEILELGRNERVETATPTTKYVKLTKILPSWNFSNIVVMDKIGNNNSIRFNQDGQVVTLSRELVITKFIITLWSGASQVEYPEFWVSADNANRKKVNFMQKGKINPASSQGQKTLLVAQDNHHTYNEEEKTELKQQLLSLNRTKQTIPTVVPESPLFINVGDKETNREQHIQRISNGHAFDRIAIAPKKILQPTANLIVEVRKWIKAYVNNEWWEFWAKKALDLQAYWTGGELLATGTVRYNEINDVAKEKIIQLNTPVELPLGWFYSIVVKQEGGIINSANYYQLACDTIQFSECFRAVAVNEDTKTLSKIIPFCKADGFYTEMLVKITSPKQEKWQKAIREFFANKTVTVGRWGHTTIPVFKNRKFKKIYVEFEPVQALDDGGQIVRRKWGNNISYNTNGNVSYFEVEIGIGEELSIFASNSSWRSNYALWAKNVKIYEVDPVLEKEGAVIYPREFAKIGEVIEWTLFGFHNDKWVGPQIDTTTPTTPATTGTIPPGNYVTYLTVIGPDGKKYKVWAYAE